MENSVYVSVYFSLCSMWHPSSSMTKRSRLYSRNNYVIQQDRAPSHTGSVNEAYL